MYRGALPRGACGSDGRTALIFHLPRATAPSGQRPPSGVLPLPREVRIFPPRPVRTGNRVAYPFSSRIPAVSAFASACISGLCICRPGTAKHADTPCTPSPQGIFCTFASLRMYGPCCALLSFSHLLVSLQSRDGEACFRASFGKGSTRFGPSHFPQ